MPARQPTSIDVAREAGVSQTTVSRVLNGGARVSPSARAKVEAAIARLGYRPNLSARSLVTSRTRTVGVVLGELGNTFYTELLSVISTELARDGYRTLILSDRDDENLATLLWESNVDGVIVTTSLLRAEAERRIASLAMPTVTMGLDAPEGADAIAPDNLTGGRLAARHLLGLGHRRIGVIAGPLAAASVRDRHAGFLEELSRQRLEPVAVLPADFDYARAYAAAMQMLTAGEPPTAMFCENDLMAFAALNAAAALGVDVPDRLSILGFDDVTMASWESFRLSTVRLPVRQMAVGAVTMLLQRFAEPARDSAHQLLPCTLVERATTRPPSGAAA